MKNHKKRPVTLNYPPGIGQVLQGTNGCYQITRELATGGMGRAYTANPVGKPKIAVVLKVPNIDWEKYSDQEIAARCALIYETSMREAASWSLFQNNPAVAAFLDCGAALFQFPDGACRLCVFTVHEKVAGTELVSWCQQHFAFKGKFQGLPPEIFFRMARRLALGLDSFHTLRLVHGDLWSRNIMVRENRDPSDPQPCLIDQGASWFMNRRPMEESGRAGLWNPTLAPERMEPATRLRANIDVYALGMVLLYLATGETGFVPFQKVAQDGPLWRVIDPSLKSTLEIRTELAEMIMTRNPELHASSPGALEIIRHCLSPNLADRPAFGRHVVRLIDQFSGNGERTTVLQLINHLDAARKALAGLEKTKPQPFRKAVLEHVITELGDTIDRPQDGVSLVNGGRENMLASVLNSLWELGPGDSCQAVVTPLLFRSGNLGSGRLLTALSMAAELGVKVEWVLAHARATQRSEEASTLIAVLKRALAEHDQRFASKPGAKDKSHPEAANFQVVVHPMPSPEFKQLVEARQTFVLMRSKNGPNVMIAPDYDSNGDLTALRYWFQPVMRQYLETHKEQMLTGTSAKGCNPDGVGHPLRIARP